MAAILRVFERFHFFLISSNYRKICLCTHRQASKSYRIVWNINWKYNHDVMAAVMDLSHIFTCIMRYLHLAWSHISIIFPYVQFRFVEFCNKLANIDVTTYKPRNCIRGMLGLEYVSVSKNTPTLETVYLKIIRFDFDDI